MKAKDIKLLNKLETKLLTEIEEEYKCTLLSIIPMQDFEEKRIQMPDKAFIIDMLEFKLNDCNSKIISHLITGFVNKKYGS